MPPLSSSILPGGIVYLKVSGALSKEYVPEIEKGLEENLSLIKEQYLATGGKIFHLADISEFDGKYDAEAIELLTTFAKGTGDMIAKGVIFGGSLSTEMIAKMVVMISGRKDVEILHTREEAIASLKAAGAMAT